MKLKLLSAVAALVACSGDWALTKDQRATKIGACLGMYEMGLTFQTNSRLQRSDEESAQRMRFLIEELKTEFDDPVLAFEAGTDFEAARLNNMNFLIDLMVTEQDWEARQDKNLVKVGCESL